MLDLKQYPSLGAAFREALERWPDEICLIEADRERENHRFTYREFKQQALPIARALQEKGIGAGDRIAVLMTNQSKWLLSAYVIFYRGGVLVPLDYKLTAPEHQQLLKHSHARVLIVEYFLWRNLVAVGGVDGTSVELVLVTEAPPNADLAGAQRWEEFRVEDEPEFVPREPKDWASIVYSSGTGGRPKGCVMTHENYLEQCMSLTALYPFWPGVRYLSILPTNHAIDFMVGFIGPFTCGAAVVHLRTLRPEFVREAFPRYKITYLSLVPMVLKNLERRTGCHQPRLHAQEAAAVVEPVAAARHPSSFRRGTACYVRWRRFHRARHPAVLLRPRHPGRERVWPHRGRHRHHPERFQALPA
jgi:long-subunit acyl-CoA synthetase (AMP-forming)